MMRSHAQKFETEPSRGRIYRCTHTDLKAGNSGIVRGLVSI